MMYRDPMRVLAYVTLLCTTMIATAQCMDGTDPHSPGATIDVIHLGGDVAVDENQSNTLHNLRDDLAAKDSKALTNELRSDDKPYSSTFLQAIENMTYFPTQIIRALHMFSVPIEHMQTTMNFALIPRASLPWIQTTGASLCIDNSYNILSESKVLTTLDDADFAQRVQAAIETQNEMEARTVFHAYVHYHFSLANPMRERTTGTYVMERTLFFDELAFSNSFMYLEADFRVASTDPRCMGKHSIVVLLNIQYDKSAYVEEEDRFAPVPDDGEEVNNSDVDHHLGAKGEKFLLGAEEVTLISLVTSLTNEVTMAQLYAQEASPFYGRLRRVVIRIRITTKCPEAIHLYNLFYEIRILDIDAPIDFLKNNTGLVPVSALPPFLAKEEENFLHITNRKVVMISSKIGTQLVEWFDVRSIRVGPVPDVSFYILPKRRPGSNTWSIWFGATAHIDYRGSVKITLSCPAKATQLHLQSGDLRSLVIHGFNIMTGVFPDAHHPDEHACDEVLVELSFPRRSFVLSVENLFFLCNHGPCKYKRTGLFHEDSHTTLQTIQNTSTPRKTTIRSIPYSALLPHSESPIAATKPRSPLRFKEGRTRRPRYVIGLAFGLSLLGIMVGATIFLVFSRSRRLLSHSRRMISVDCVFDKSSGGLVLETLKDSEDVHIMCKYPGASGDDLDGFHTLRTNTTCSTCLNH